MKKKKKKKKKKVRYIVEIIVNKVWNLFPFLLIMISGISVQVYRYLTPPRGKEPTEAEELTVLGNILIMPGNPNVTKIVQSQLPAMVLIGLSVPRHLDDRWRGTADADWVDGERTVLAPRPLRWKGAADRKITSSRRWHNDTRIRGISFPCRQMS